MSTTPIMRSHPIDDLCGNYPFEGEIPLSRTAARSQDEAFLGVFEEPISIQGGVDVRCPTCTRESNPDWHFLEAAVETRSGVTRVTGLPRGTKQAQQVSLDYMHCANEQCKQLILRIHDARPVGWLDGTAGIPMLQTETWMVFPRFGEAASEVDPLVPEPFRTDYAEAAALLEISPRMSAVLSRRILADLLEKYLDLTAYGLNERINDFRAKQDHPKRLRDGAHHFREIGDFGSHTQKNDQDQIIPVDRDDAAWMLNYLDRFIDHYVVGPEKDAAVLSAMRWRL